MNTIQSNGLLAVIQTLVFAAVGCERSAKLDVEGTLRVAPNIVVISEEIHRAIIDTVRDARDTLDNHELDSALTELGKALVNLRRFDEADSLNDSDTTLRTFSIQAYKAKRLLDEDKVDEADRVAQAHRISSPYWLVKLALASARLGHPVRAERFLEQATSLLEGVNDSRSLAEIGVAYTSLGKLSIGRELLKRARSLEKLEPPACEGLFDPVSVMQVRAGFISDALEIDRGESLRRLLVAEALANASHWKEAVTVAKDCEAWHAIHALADIAGKQNSRGLKDDAVATMASASAILEELKDPLKATRKRQTIVAAYSKIGEFDLAQRHLQLVDRTLLPDVYAHAITDLAEALSRENWSECAPILHVARAAAAKAEKIDCLCRIATAFHAGNLQEAAQNTLTEAQEISLKRSRESSDRKGRSDLLNLVAATQAMIGDREGAAATFDFALKAAGENHSRVRDVCKCMARHEFFDQAVLVARKLDLPSPRQALFQEVARLHARASSPEAALQWVRGLPVADRAFALFGITESSYSD